MSRGSRPSDDQLLDGARAAFARFGFSGTTMEQIAEAAACTKPTLYAHFGSKQKVYLAALQREANTVRDWLFDAYKQADGLPMHGQIRAGMAAIFSFADAHPDGFRLLFATEAAGHSRIMDELWTAVIARIDDMIRAYRAERHRTAGGHTATLAAAAVGAAVFGVRYTHLSRGGPPPGRALDIVSAFAEAAFANVDPALLDD